MAASTSLTREQRVERATKASAVAHSIDVQGRRLARRITAGERPSPTVLQEIQAAVSLAAREAAAR